MEMLKLICTLRNHVITDEGDFVPAGTPVQVIGWSGNDRGGEVTEPARIEVRTSAYVFADTFDYESVSNGYSTGCVNDGLYLSVPPEALVYSGETHMCEVREKPRAAKATR
jgi:hypothetical protein